MPSARLPPRGPLSGGIPSHQQQQKKSAPNNANLLQHNRRRAQAVQARNSPNSISESIGQSKQPQTNTHKTRTDGGHFCVWLKMIAISVPILNVLKWTPKLL
ncbi:hypothetical protein GPALN_002993 [Globodera pallida]|nr:hypothetical protein GPALN_002993 [Globodera pallida]